MTISITSSTYVWMDRSAFLSCFGGCDNVGLGHTTKRHAVQLVGTCHKEKPRFELLQHHNTLSLEVTREHNHNGASRDGFTQLGLLPCVVVVSELALNILSCPC